MIQLPGFEAIEEPPKEDEEDEEDEEEYEEAKEVLPSKSKEGLKIAKFTLEDLDRNLMNKEAQDILKVNEYYKLPSDYFEEDVSTIDKVIEDVNEDLEDTSKSIKNTAIITRDPNGYAIAKPISKNPREKTINFIKKITH